MRTRLLMPDLIALPEQFAQLVGLVAELWMYEVSTTCGGYQRRISNGPARVRQAPASKLLPKPPTAASRQSKPTWVFSKPTSAPSKRMWAPSRSPPRPAPLSAPARPAIPRWNGWNWMELDGNSNRESSVAFLSWLRERHPGPLNVIWNNAPAHRGEAVREYLRTPGLMLRLVNLPGYSPDFNADEAVWGWVREEATGNLCLGTKALVQQRISNFLAGLANWKDEVKRRCRTLMQSKAEGLARESSPNSNPASNAHFTLALV